MAAAQQDHAEPELRLVIPWIRGGRLAQQGQSALREVRLAVLRHRVQEFFLRRRRRRFPYRQAGVEPRSIGGQGGRLRGARRNPLEVRDDAGLRTAGGDAPHGESDDQHRAERRRDSDAAWPDAEELPKRDRPAVITAFTERVGGFEGVAQLGRIFHRARRHGVGGVAHARAQVLGIQPSRECAKRLGARCHDRPPSGSARQSCSFASASSVFTLSRSRPSRVAISVTHRLSVQYAWNTAA